MVSTGELRSKFRPYFNQVLGGCQYNAELLSRPAGILLVIDSEPTSIAIFELDLNSKSVV